MGRSGILASLEQRIAANGSAVLTGPSGIGKTAVLEACGTAAAARGELVLQAAGIESERWIPYTGLAELLGQVPVEHRTALPEPGRSALHSVLLRDRHTTTPDGQLQAVCRLAWRALLGRCAADAPVLLLVDDAQWLDTGSMDAVRYAARRLTGHGVRIVTAGRWPGGPVPEDATAGPPWAPTPTAVQLPVPPLAPHELAELFESYGLPARVANTLHADSGGNPYLALVLGGAFTERIPRHWRPAPLPQRVHGMIGERLATLPGHTRETLLTAALITRPTTGLLRRAGRSTADHDIRLAAAAGLLVTEGGTLRFTPPAVGTVLTEYADAAHLAEVHTVLAEVVPDAAGRVRHRALASSGMDAELARSLVITAEASARRGSGRMAAELYLLAADRTPVESTAERLEWLVAAAETGAAASQPALVHRAVEAVLAADSAPAHRARARIALIDLSGQALAEMDEVFAAALVDAEGDPSLMAPLRLRMSWSAMAVGHHERSEREADIAIGHARAAGDTATEAMALANKASTAMLMGRTDHGALLEQALRLPELPLNGWIHATPRFLATRFAVFEDRLPDARDQLLRMLALIGHGSGEEVVHVLCSLAEVSSRMGHCQDALDFADRAVRIAEYASLSPGPAWYDAAVAELAGGSIDRALGYAQRGLRASEQERDAIYQGRHLHVLGQARLRTGDLRGGVRALLRIQTLERDQGVCSPLALRWHSDLVHGLAALGEPEAAEDVLRSARAAVGSRTGGGGVIGRLDRAEAAVRAARGEPDAALELLRGAARRFESLGQPLEVGHCLLETARVERRRRRRAPARAAVDEALALFTRCGARPWAEQAGRTLDQDPAGGDPAGHEERGLLTDNEERIASLVGEGATNQEVATRMFLSVKTIEASLTRIYRKLGIRSRTQLGSRLRSGVDTGSRLYAARPRGSSTGS